jgi:hypothetical protein
MLELKHHDTDYIAHPGLFYAKKSLFGVIMILQDSYIVRLILC